jgi:hypothetical protein
MKKKSYGQMNLEELREATKEFDKEFIADTFGPMPPEARKQWERMKARPGRPKVGKGAKVISLSVEKGLLERSDKLAHKMGISRAELVSRGLRVALLVEEGR